MSKIKLAREWADEKLSISQVAFVNRAVLEELIRSIQRDALEAVLDDLRIFADEQLAIPNTLGSIHAVAIDAARDRVRKIQESL